MLTDADIQLHADKIRDDGYTVIERAADPALVEGLKQALERTERDTASATPRRRSRVSRPSASTIF